MTSLRLASSALAAVLVVAACSGPAATVAPTPPATAAPSPAVPTSGAIGTFDEAIGAVLQIEAVGTFRDPEAGERVESGGAPAS